jgi:hypothetical protein
MECHRFSAFRLSNAKPESLIVSFQIISAEKIKNTFQAALKIVQMHSTYK